MRKAILVFLIIWMILAAVNTIRGEDGKVFDRRLLGKWQSDKEKTLEWNNGHFFLTDDKIKEFLAKSYGELILEFTNEKIISTREGRPELRYEHPLSIIWAHKDVIVFVIDVPDTDDKTLRVIKIESEDLLWLRGMEYGLREYFKRIR